MTGEVMAVSDATDNAQLIENCAQLGYRPQPPGRRQLHARRNYSTLMVFR